ncbi:MIT C-terminal domain-containing protein, partial [Pseudoponticoccus marisrubri]|uniref:MIT C-terminal domain-containing protein n=1 Tax=Pseudoponticoccus marisrubri TaxID=1685382 RepID=UPI0012FE7694
APRNCKRVTSTSGEPEPPVWKALKRPKLSDDGHFDTSGTAHARDIVTDTGWKIVLDRGLDIFQAPVRREGFNLGDRLQEHRMVKGFYVTYVRQ